MKLFFINSYGMYMNAIHHVEADYKDMSKVKEVNSINDLKSIIEEYKNQKIYPGIKAIKVFTDTEFGLKNVQHFNILYVENIIEKFCKESIAEEDCFTKLVDVLTGEKEY